jgi:hypothetical protein
MKEEFEDIKYHSESVFRRRTENTMAKRKSTKDKQRSTKHTYKTKDRVTRILLRTGGRAERRCSKVISSSSRGEHAKHYATDEATEPGIAHG